MRAKTEQFAACQPKQNKTARNLKVRDRDSKRGENNLSEKNEADGHTQSSKYPEKRLSFAMFV